MRDEGSEERPRDIRVRGEKEAQAEGAKRTGGTASLHCTVCLVEDLSSLWGAVRVLTGYSPFSWPDSDEELPAS